MIAIRSSRAVVGPVQAHAEPSRVRAAVDAAAHAALPDALAGAFGPLFDAGTLQGIWIVRRLRVRATVKPGWDARQVAQAWAAEAARALVQAVEAGDDALWFPSLGALLARFAADVARGTAWGQWAYARFEGLRLLSTSACLRTALLETPAAGLQALHLLERAELAAVLAALTAQDARTLADALAGEADPPHLWDALAAALATVDESPIDGAGEAGPALRLLVEASRASGAPWGPAAQRAARALARLLRLAAQMEQGSRAALWAALEQGSAAALYAAVRATDAEVLAPLLGAPAVLLEAAAAHVQPARPPAAAPPAEPASVETAFGGLFLLLPVLAEMPLDAWCAGWPACPSGTETVEAAALLRLLLLAKAQGAARSLRALYDPVLRRVCGVPPALEMGQVQAWARAVPPRRQRQLLAALAAWQRARGAIQDHAWLLVPVGRGAWAVDAARGLWLGAARAARRGAAPAHVLGPGPLPALDEGMQAIPGLAEVAARRERFADERRFLATPRALLPRGLDALLSIAAQHLLRGFAWRLPGFAYAPLPYLHANLLALRARMIEEPERVRVHLSPPPLHLLLSMTGMARARVRLPWLDAPPFVYFPE